MKNLLLTMAALLFTVSSIAQLYVIPNGTDASYVYVKDQILYVEGSIGLVENPSPSTEKASIYFRDGAQLIQGGTVSSNSGSGYISIYQDNPNYDAYDYTYWSSPIGDQTVGAGSGNRSFGTMRVFDVQGLTESTVNLPTNNVNGVKSPNMRISNRWLYTYANATGWSRINASSLVQPGRGFTMKGLGLSDEDQTYDFRGRPNTGDIIVPVSAPSGPNLTYNLAGNPYPSAIDLKLVFDDNPLLAEIRFWDEDRSVDSHYYVDNKGGYGVWVPMGNDPIGAYTVAPFMNYNNDGSTGTGTGTDGGVYSRRYAPIAQGFMLMGNALGTVTFKNSHRVYEKEGTYSQFRSNDNDPIVYNEAESAVSATTGITNTRPRTPHLRLNTYFNESHMRQMVLAFSDEATDGYDRGYDGRSPMDAVSGDAFFPIGGDEKLPYVIQGTNFEITKQIPYTVKVDVQSRVVITAIQKINFDGPAYIYDNVEDSYKEITNGLSAELVLAPGTYEDRFFITFVNRHRTQQVANENAKVQALENLDFFQNNPAQQLEVGNPEGYDITNANIFSMSGQLVYKATNLGSNSKLTFPTGNLSDGIYLVMLTTKDNVSINYKITVKNK